MLTSPAPLFGAGGLGGGGGYFWPVALGQDGVARAGVRKELCNEKRKPRCLSNTIHLWVPGSSVHSDGLGECSLGSHRRPDMMLLEEDAQGEWVSACSAVKGSREGGVAVGAGGHRFRPHHSPSWWVPVYPTSQGNGGHKQLPAGPR